METVLIVIHLLIAVALVVCVLLQRTAQDGGGLMGGGSGTMGGLFTARGSANVLTRTTAVLATLFVGMSLLLGILAGQTHQGASLAERVAPLVEEKTDAPEKTEPVAPPAEAAQDFAPSVPVTKR